MTIRVSILILAMATMAAKPAFAGGFLLQEQSQLEIGHAFSGAAASADAPSTIFYNPAGMTKLDGGVRLGVHYRSRIRHEVKGDYVLSGLAAPLSAANDTTAVRSPLTLPDIATASISAPVGTDTRLMLTGRYYNWSVLKDIRFLRAGEAPAIKELHYRDSWGVSAGIDHRISGRLTLRTGAMFDRTPTNEAI